MCNASVIPWGFPSAGHGQPPRRLLDRHRRQDCPLLSSRIEHDQSAAAVLGNRHDIGREPDNLTSLAKKLVAVVAVDDHLSAAVHGNTYFHIDLAGLHDCSSKLRGGGEAPRRPAKLAWLIATLAAATI